MNKVEVIICGKVFTVVGSETEEYMHNVARYIDKKMAKLVNTSSSKNFDQSTVSILTSINVADDLFKQQDENEQLKKIILDKDSALEAKDTVINDKDNQIEKYLLEMGKMQNENLALLEKISDLQLDITYANTQIQTKNEALEKSKKEIEEYVANFDLVPDKSFETKRKPKGYKY